MALKEFIYKKYETEPRLIGMSSFKHSLEARETPLNNDSSTLSSDKIDKCPVCLENPEDQGNCTVCARCGSFVCGTCSIQMCKTNQRSCPNCRENYANQIVEIISLLSTLHEREIRREDGPRPHRLDFIEASLGILMWHEGMEPEKTKLYLIRTAKKGFFGSMCSLGYVYFTEGDYRKAMEMFLKSNRMHFSLKGMAQLYREGRGVKQDKKYAECLVKIADTIGGGYTHCKTGKALYV